MKYLKHPGLIASLTLNHIASYRNTLICLFIRKHPPPPASVRNDKQSLEGGGPLCGLY